MLHEGWEAHVRMTELFEYASLKHFYCLTWGLHVQTLSIHFIYLEFSFASLACAVKLSICYTKR